MSVRSPDSDQTRYIRGKAERIRTEARKADKASQDILADGLRTAARQLDIVADEIDAGFHEPD